MAVVQKPQVEVEPEPEQVGYCLNEDCDQDEFKLWHNLVTHPVMCQCGTLLQAERPEPVEA